MANPDEPTEPAANTEPPAEAAASSGEPAAAESAKIDAAPEAASAAEEPARISYLKPFTRDTEHAAFEHATFDHAAFEHATFDHAAFEQPQRSMLRRYLPLAASLVLAAVLGAFAGVAATAVLGESKPATAPAAQALQETMTRLEGEVATLRTGIATAQRNTAGQIGKLAERLDRTEKAQAEPAAKLAKVMESLDRLERRLPPQPVAAQPAQPAPEVTGSVTAKQEAKPPVVADGWHLLDAYGGRAVVESRSGRVFEVVVGTNLPGLGRVDAIKRLDGRVMVVTRNGIIAGPVEPLRRSGYYTRYID